MGAPKGNKFAAGNKGGGRPTKYKVEFARAAKKLAELGATDIEIADGLGVSERLIRDWRSRRKEFSAALKVGKSQADERVERSLYQRAVGYTYESEKIFNASGEILRAPYREHVPPDVAASFIWLKNRCKEQWRDKSEIEHSGEVALATAMDQIKRRRNAR